ncbi:MAG: HNH endonuclease, partial [Gallionellaceae bacterium]|nr:HNH endonuclease [Gallionellaceae bacterium]
MFDTVLALDISGTPNRWISYQSAATLYVTGKVAWDLGEANRVLLGGCNRRGEQSSVSIKPIVAVAKSELMVKFAKEGQLTLSDRDNLMLFRRDRDTCAYCGQIFPRSKLTRDHIVARSRGGTNSWMNCVTACQACNQAKGAKRLEDFRP